MRRPMLNLKSKVDDVVRPGGEILLSDGDLDLVAVGGAYKVPLSVKPHDKHGASEKSATLGCPEEAERHVALAEIRKPGRIAAAECAFTESDGILLSLHRESTMVQMSRIRPIYTEKKRAIRDTQFLWRELSGLESLEDDPMRRPSDVAAFYGDSPNHAIAQVMKIRYKFIAIRGAYRRGRVNKAPYCPRRSRVAFSNEGGFRRSGMAAYDTRLCYRLVGQY